jgi:hypothetical protein
MRTRCGEGCSSGGTAMQADFGELSSSTTSCRRIESIALERGSVLFILKFKIQNFEFLSNSLFIFVAFIVRSNFGSNYSESSSEYDSNQFLCRRSRTQPHPLAYRQIRYSDKMNARQASTLVNLTAFRSVQSTQLDPEFEAILMNSSTPKVITDKSSPLNSKGELV